MQIGHAQGLFTWVWILDWGQIWAWFGLVERAAIEDQGIRFLPALKTKPGSPRMNLKLGIDVRVPFLLNY